ncbi:MAG: HAD family hydrolase [Phycisphaeraceae bacterium]|nr:HAD family hydrolase [Phycisphaeraceae bacterium]
MAIDMDGTLLRSDGRLTRRVVETVHEVQNRGVKVIIATARPPRGVAEIAEVLRLDTLQITYNGAMIFDPVRRKHTYHKPLDSALVKKMIKAARKADKQVVVSLEILDKWYTDHVDETLPTETSRRFSPDFVGPLEAFLHVPITKLLLLAPPERIGPIREAVEGKFADKVTAAISDKHLLQYIHKEADKSIALAQIAESYGIPAESVMAIGDAPNDVRMLHWAGLGVAVENGWEVARQFADVVVPSNDNDGVAFALRKYVLEQ